MIKNGGDDNKRATRNQKKCVYMDVCGCTYAYRYSNCFRQQELYLHCEGNVTGNKEGEAD
jgi:hypothetical protein